MNPGAILPWLKRNGLIGLLVISIVTAIFWRPGSTAPPVSEEVTPVTDVAVEQEALRQTMKDAQARQRGIRTSREEAQSDLATHLEALEKELPPDERAARLCALGNLYQQKKQDYATAAGYYELLIEEFPEWPGISTAFHQLITCYTRLEDQQSLRLLYREMIRIFPEESTEYQYAEAALAGAL